MTASEKKLWAVLRKLDLGLRRQAPIGRYIADFVQHSAKLVIEVDGGCHNLPEVQLRDAAREAWLTSQGYRVLRVGSGQAYGDPWPVAETAKAMVKASRNAAAAPYGGSSFDGPSTPSSPPLPRSRGKGGAS
jgi:very-short-patch-repair endonuclease